jgi:PAS domain-containing protein
MQPMRLDYTAFLILAPFMAIAVLGATVLVWRRRRNPGVRFLLVFAVGAFGYLVFNSLELLSATREWTLFWAKGEHVWAVLMPVFWLLFVFDFTGHRDWIRPLFIFPLIVPGIIDVVLTYTNKFHHLIWTNERFFPVGASLGLQTDHGPYFYISVIFDFLVLLLGVGIVQRELRSSHGLYRRQLLWISSGVIIPILFALIYVFGLAPGLAKDYTPLGLALGALMFVGAFYRSRFLDLAPASRMRIFDALPDGVVVLDTGYRIVDMNRHAMSILSLTENMVGAPLGYNRGVALLIENLTADSDEVTSDISTGEGDDRRFFELKLRRLSSTENGRDGLLLILHDITDRVRLLDEIRTLRGIVPICARCKKIRDDDGFWQHVETYVAQHSYAEFSHGLCPDCLEKLHPKE